MTNEVFWAAISAIGSIAGAAVAFLVLIFAIPTLIEARRARRITLSITLSERFGSDAMHAALVYLGRRRDQYNGDIKTMGDAYVAEVSAEPLGRISEWSRCRRMVSKFFIAAYALSKAGLLEPHVFAEQIQRASIDLYVQVVAPLDEVHAKGVLGHNEYFDQRIRDYFVSFLALYFDHKSCRSISATRSTAG